jgi:hypothetical protein
MTDIANGVPVRPAWRNYEDVANTLLNRFREDIGALVVEGRQSVPHLYADTEYEIDGRAVISDGTFLIVECRRTSRAMSQEDMGAIAYRVESTGAGGGIVVSPLRPQDGAQSIATAENIQSVELSSNSTTEQFAIRIARHMRMGIEGVAGHGTVGTLTVHISNGVSGEGAA